MGDAVSYSDDFSIYFLQSQGYLESNLGREL